MKVKTFQIRLSKEHLEADIQLINEYIELVEVKRVMSELITGQVERWSVTKGRMLHFHSLQFRQRLEINRLLSFSNRYGVSLGTEI